MPQSPADIIFHEIHLSRMGFDADAVKALLDPTNGDAFQQLVTVLRDRAVVLTRPAPVLYDNEAVAKANEKASSWGYALMSAKTFAATEAIAGNDCFRPVVAPFDFDGIFFLGSPDAVVDRAPNAVQLLLPE